MKKTTKKARNLLLSTERIRDLDPSALQSIAGGKIGICDEEKSLCPDTNCQKTIISH